MEAIYTKEEIEEFEKQRALVGGYVDLAYSEEGISWILDARSFVCIFIVPCLGATVALKTDDNK